MVCSKCANAKSNGGECQEGLSSNGHSTWGTPIFQDVYDSVDDLGYVWSPKSEDECFAFSILIENKFVVLYDNGTGFMEWASTPQPTKELAIENAKLAGGALPNFGTRPCVLLNLETNEEEVL